MHESDTQPVQPFSPGSTRQWLIFVAQALSIVFHPLFIPVYGALFLLYIHPYLFAGYSDLFKLQRLATVFLNMTFIPGFSVFLMWRLRLIESMKLTTARERIIPYAATIVFYFWCWYVLSRQTDSPEAFVNFLQGCFFGVCAAWIININSKISMHTTAMGGLVTFMLLFSYSDNTASTLFLALTFLVAGLVTTARNLVSDHSRLEIIQGLVAGTLSMLMAWFI